MDWVKERWPGWAAGLLLWVLLAAGAALTTSARGDALWHRILTWDEWVVAVGVLVRAIIPIFRVDEMVNPTARRGIGLVGEATWVLLVVFLLDLLTRAVLGLGWKPF